MHWYLEVLKKYAMFSGRARRKEYWMFCLFNFIIIFVVTFIDTLVCDLTGLGPSGGITGGIGFGGYLLIIYFFAVLIPGIAVAIRRLHDTNRSGWWLLIAFIPLIGGIILFVFMVLDSQLGDNQYGPNPKAAT